LEALCKDLGRSHEEYTKKLEKLRRSQPAPAMTQANGGASVCPSVCLSVCLSVPVHNIIAFLLKM
jgi:hypothetical protein